MQHKDIIVLKKIIAEIDIGLSLICNSDLSSFMESELLKRATAMTTINVGELIKSVSEEVKLQHHDIPWKAAAGLRDLAAHKYQTLRMEDVYNTVKDDFPTLKTQLQEILDKA